MLLAFFFTWQFRYDEALVVWFGFIGCALLHCALIHCALLYCAFVYCAFLRCAWVSPLLTVAMFRVCLVSCPFCLLSNVERSTQCSILSRCHSHLRLHFPTCSLPRSLHFDLLSILSFA